MISLDDDDKAILAKLIADPVTAQRVIELLRRVSGNYGDAILFSDNPSATNPFLTESAGASDFNAALMLGGM